MQKLISKREFWELAFLAALVAGALIVIAAAEDIPPSYFDQLGAAFFPTLIAWLIIGLCSPLILSNLKSLYRSYSADTNSAQTQNYRQVVQVLLISILSVAYISGISLRMIPYSLLTGVFITLAVISLKDRPGQHLFRIIIAAFISGGLLEYLFTQVFVMDLPHF